MSDQGDDSWKPEEEVVERAPPTLEQTIKKRGWFVLGSSIVLLLVSIGFVVYDNVFTKKHPDAQAPRLALTPLILCGWGIVTGFVGIAAVFRRTLTWASGFFFMLLALGIVSFLYVVGTLIWGKMTDHDLQTEYCEQFYGSVEECPAQFIKMLTNLFWVTFGLIAGLGLVSCTACTVFAHRFRAAFPAYEADPLAYTRMDHDGAEDGDVFGTRGGDKHGITAYSTRSDEEL